MAKKPAKRLRDPDATQLRILTAARAEFARNGLGGARVDVIAARAKANKRMIYHYFGSKDQLFRRVVEAAYEHIRSAERALDLAALAPVDALARLVRFTWDYYLANPEFITLVNSANLHKARHVRDSEEFRHINRSLIGITEALLERGVAAGDFRKGIDPVQLTITIAALGYYYLTNRYTMSIIAGKDLMARPALDERQRFNLETILRLVCTDPEREVKRLAAA